MGKCLNVHLISLWSAAIRAHIPYGASLNSGWSLSVQPPLLNLLHPHQNRILRILAINSTKQTNVENPSASFSLRIFRYWGIYGTTPPNTIAPMATHVTSSVANAIMVSYSESGCLLSAKTPCPATSAILSASSYCSSSHVYVWHASPYFKNYPNRNSVRIIGENHHDPLPNSTFWGMSHVLSSAKSTKNTENHGKSTCLAFSLIFLLIMGWFLLPAWSIEGALDSWAGSSQEEREAGEGQSLPRDHQLHLWKGIYISGMPI